MRRVNTQALDGVGGQVRHQGVAARYAAARLWAENELEGLVEAAAGRALVLILDGVQDPHNLGACLRSAAAAGVTAVVIPKDKSATVNATVRKTSAGAADRIPVVAVTNLARCLRDLQKQGCGCMAWPAKQRLRCTAWICAAMSGWFWVARPMACAVSPASTATAWSRSRCPAKSKASMCRSRPV